MDHRIAFQAEDSVLKLSYFFEIESRNWEVNQRQSNPEASWLKKLQILDSISKFSDDVGTESSAWKVILWTRKYSVQVWVKRLGFET